MMKPDEVEAMLGLYELVGERSASRRNASGEPEGLTAERACQFGRADQRQMRFGRGANGGTAPLCHRLGEPRHALARCRLRPTRHTAGRILPAPLMQVEGTLVEARGARRPSPAVQLHDPGRGFG